MKYVVATAIILSLVACNTKTASLSTYGAVPDFQLTAQTGQPFDSKTLAGKIWVADFIYTTCPGPCPRMTSQMHQVQQAILPMGDVKLVSFTVDRSHDTPPVLAEYAKVHGASAEHWYFLTGPQPTLQMLDKDAFKLGDVDGKLMHSTRFVLVDRNARIRAYYDTSESDAIDRVIRDIMALARERS
jgi:protein SCO1/2